MECGSYGGLQRIGFHSDNVLSQAAAYDAGANFAYDFATDTYPVEFTDKTVLHFRRKVLPFGRKTRHYSCGTAKSNDTMSHAFVNTVRDNLRRNSKSEVQAENAREFQRKLRYATSAVAIDIISGGVLHSVVTVAHIQAGDAIFGYPFAVEDRRAAASPAHDPSRTSNTPGCDVYPLHALLTRAAHVTQFITCVLLA